MSACQDGPSERRASRCAVEALEPRKLFSNTLWVTNTADAGPGSLRQAIQSADQAVGPAAIDFAIGSGPATIVPYSPLPTLGTGITLDATTQPGYAGSPIITIDGSDAGSYASGIVVSGGSCTIRGLVIDDFSSDGIYLSGAGSNTVQNNYIGINASGTAAAANGGHGILDASPNDLIGGTLASQRNIISGNGGQGVILYSSSAFNDQVEGNYIGTNAWGNAAVPNYLCGITIYGSNNNTIGGSSSGDGNLISGNGNDGVVILGGSTGNTVAGNLMGTDLTGELALPNGFYGIEVDSGGNTVGGLTAGARNVISGNAQAGVVLYQPNSIGNVIEGNYIGSDITGTKSVGVQPNGVDIDDGASNNTIGGTTPAAGNLISGNLNEGLGFFGTGTTGNVAQNNKIGTTASGLLSLGNGLVGENGNGAGVLFDNGAGGNTLGTPGDGNLVSGNGAGVVLFGSTDNSQGNTVQANAIGADATGAGDLPNAGDGVLIIGNNNTVGGAASSQGNAIYGNTSIAIVLDSGYGNVIQNNSVAPAVPYTGGTGSGNSGGGSSGGATSGNGSTGATSTVQFTGTPSASTTGSYDGKSSDNYTAVFDANTNTYFDSPQPNGNWVQLDLGSTQTITQIAYAPRAGFEYRMVGGIFEASNDPTFGTGVVALDTVASTPNDGLTTQTVSPGGGYRYVRYLAPANSWGNIAEFQVFGTASASSIGSGSSGSSSSGSNSGSTSGGSTSGGSSSGGSTSGTTTNGNSTQLIPVATSGTPGSYDGQSTDTYTAAFDGNTNTSFDAPQPSGDYVEADLGSPQNITAIAYAPRAGFEYRMAGGIFEASNDPTFGTGVVTLYTLPSTPNDGLTTQAVSPGGAYRYVRYVAPANAWGNIAELQIFGTAASTSGSSGGSTGASGSTGAGNSSGSGNGQSAGNGGAAIVQLSGTPSANITGSYDGGTSDNYTAVFDGNTNTYFDSSQPSGNWVQLDLGSTQTITQIAYAPRAGFEYRMIGGVFEASNDPTFSTGVVTLLTIASTPNDGLTTQAVSPGGNYRYLRYVAPASSWGNIAEMQVFGPGASLPSAGGSNAGGSGGATGAGAGNAGTPAQLIPVATTGTTGSYDGQSTDTFAAAFDNNTNTYFDAPQPNGDFIQADLGTAHTITSIAFAPRPGFEYRMTGGIFEASNDPTFTTGVTTLYTIPATPNDGFNTVNLSITGTYRYIRYLAPTSAWGNIADVQFFGY
jgi:hypothetical protein